MKVFASCSSYVLGQLFGPERACAMMTEAIIDSKKKPPCFAVEALRHLTKLAEVTLRVDGGATHIGKSRTRHFFDALQGDADVWFSIDDDVNATAETIAWLLAAVDGKTPRVCIAPCMSRGRKAVDVEWSTLWFERKLVSGGTVRRATAGGFGLVAMNRPAIVAAARAAPSWRDEYDRNLKPAVFLESLSNDGTWTGEDISFFRRLPREVEVEALTTGKTMHAGCQLSLEAVGL